MKTKLNSLVQTRENQMLLETKQFRPVSPGIATVLLYGSFLLVVAISILTGCGSAPAKKANSNFFTSGSREADQRASERMAQAEQLSGSGEGSGEKGVKKARVAKSDASDAVTAGGTATNKPAQATEKMPLFERLGGEAGISNIVTDFTPRVMNDPRVNWNREGIKRGGISIHRGKSETWNPSPQNIALLSKHLAEFLALATGGPAHYSGGQLESVHADMHISNPEFDAAIGDLKASLDKLKIPNLEQKELLAIVESTRPQIVTKR
jgi:hemoglobin